MHAFATDVFFLSQFMFSRFFMVSCFFFHKLNWKIELVICICFSSLFLPLHDSEIFFPDAEVYPPSVCLLTSIGVYRQRRPHWIHHSQHDANLVVPACSCVCQREEARTLRGHHPFNSVFLAFFISSTVCCSRKHPLSRSILPALCTRDPPFCYHSRNYRLIAKIAKYKRKKAHKHINKSQDLFCRR